VTLHVPTWLLRLLVFCGVVAAVIAAYLIGRSSDSDQVGPVRQPLACTEAAAKEATLSNGFAEQVREAGEVAMEVDGTGVSVSRGPFFHDERGLRVELLKCVDLGESDKQEMIVGLGGGASGTIFHWAIFTQGEDRDWNLTFARHGVPVERLVVRAGELVELTPTYEEGDPLCCPSGRRAAVFDFISGRFHLKSPPFAGAERLILSDSAGITRIGPLEARSASPVDARVAFGTPSWVSQESGEVCTLSWDNLGLEIVFANLGGQDPCGPEGAIGSFEVKGVAAAQAGWQTSEGARLGMSTAELLQRYPAASFEKDQLVLVSVPTPFGEDGVTPALSAAMARGTAAAFHGFVGAAGE
jgi:hypothetical protein